MSRPVLPRFNPQDGYVDDKALATALGRISVGSPETSGGQFLDRTTVRPQYQSFNMHTPPDITPNTRIIAVCGVPPKDAAPQEDGWFISDFFAFYHLFRGLGKSDCWIHCLDLEGLISKHSVYLHGNPFKRRKVVLDQKILEGATNLIRVSAAGGLSLKFEQTLRTTCADAAKAGDESVLVLMFGHGDDRNGGVLLGSKYFKQQQFAKTFVGLNVPITIVSTACYSGGWSCNKTYDKRSQTQFNKTTMMAAGPKETSRSWNFSASTGRACGSMFTTAFVEAMTRLDTDTQLVDTEGERGIEETEEQEETYAEFCKTMYETLLKDVDRRGFEHTFIFSAEDDAWGMCWRERTGIPLGAYQARWERLAEYEADPYLHPGDPFNRDPHVTKEQEQDYGRLRAADRGQNFYHGHIGATGGAPGGSKSVLGKRKTSGMYGGSVQALINQVLCLGQQYLESYRGFDNTGNDGALHNRINMIQQGEETDQEEIEKCLRKIQYRMNQMSTADDYLRLMDVPMPFGKACHEFDTRNIHKKIGSDRYDELFRLIVDRKILFPRPLEDQGHSFSKGIHYLMAAFYIAKLKRSTVIEKLDHLVQCVRQDFEYEKAIYKELPEVKSKRQKLYRAYGIALGAISPTKRQSRGKSLGSSAY
ncbi:MAG: hypothetical protein LQ346_004890 [Caloplaca aetnensis]|nr:MAG: hypothetical protein LQ346_004890 [Caloplaca aetnensis]